MSYIQPHMTEALAKHVLEEIPGPGDGRAFLMRKPEEWDLSIYVVFFKRRIILTGDLNIGGRNGCISDTGYGIEWFSSPKSEGYLCEKFLKQEWQAEAAAEELKDWLAHPDDHGYTPEQTEAIQEIINSLEDGETGIETLYRDLVDVDAKIDLSDGVPGMDYPRRHAGWLCAVQQRFRELYQARDQSAVPDDGGELIAPEWLVSVKFDDTHADGLDSCFSLLIPPISDTAAITELRLEPYKDYWVASLWQGVPDDPKVTDDCIVLTGREFRTRRELRQLCAVLGIPQERETR